MNAIAVAGPVSGRQLHKFGGSSLADVKCYLRVAGIMAEYSQPGDMMVVSAAGSTTNQLINWLKLSQSDRLSAHRAADVASLSQRSYQRPVAAGKRRAADRRVHSGSGTPGGAAGRQRRRGVLRRSGRARRDLVGAPDGGGAQPRTCRRPGWMRVTSCAPSAPRSHRWMKAVLIRCCSNCWLNIRANARW